MVDIEHFCCIAHAPAKCKYALDQGGDKDAAFILELIGELYEIIIKLRSKLNVLLSKGHPLRGKLMEKPINYMHTFGTQLFAYLNDGSYSIDNSLAERFIRSLAGEWKNSLCFGSDKMARVSAVYHAIIFTCRMQGLCWIISRDSSARLLKDVGIMNICYP